MFLKLANRMCIPNHLPMVMNFSLRFFLNLNKFSFHKKLFVFEADGSLKKLYQMYRLNEEPVESEVRTVFG